MRIDTDGSLCARRDRKQGPYDRGACSVAGSFPCLRQPGLPHAPRSQGLFCVRIPALQAVADTDVRCQASPALDRPFIDTPGDARGNVRRERTNRDAYGGGAYRACVRLVPLIIGAARSLRRGEDTGRTTGGRVLPLRLYG